MNRVRLVTCFTAAIPLLPTLAGANDVRSSTMYFHGTLTDDGFGGKTGVLAMVDEDAEDIGDDEAGYDVFALNGGAARFSQSSDVDPITNHDGWPGWDPDTPDWYQYSLRLYVDGGQQKWAVRNHPGATATYPWYDTAHWGPGGKPPAGVPMSGLMNWTSAYAKETDTGAYLPGTGIPLVAGWAAANGGGAGAWDMDWSWGSEVVPLEMPGFQVTVTATGPPDEYDVRLTPKANTIASSTMHFEGSLADAGGGVYTGTIPMTAGAYYVPGGDGAHLHTDGGFDLYAEEAGCAYVQGYYGTGGHNCGGTDTYTIAADHDAYPHLQGGGPWGSWYDPDVADWDQYSLELTAAHWYLRYTSTHESPMSGTMDWDAMYAAESDLGTQVGGHGGSAPHGGGPGAWDWDCGWGIEVIPLQLPGFQVLVSALGGGQYHVTLTPVVTEVWVDDDFDSSTPGWGVTHFDNIQDGIDAVSGSTVNVAAGTYGPFVLTSTVTLLGAQAGVDARGRVVGAPSPASESIVTAVSGILCEFRNGSGGSIIDGFSFVGGGNALRSNGGPLDGVQILNNHVEGTSSSAVFLNDHGDDITIHQNAFDGSSMGSGGLVHLDTDTFDGFHFTSNWVKNGSTGFFVDGNRNVGASGLRSPLFQGNLFLDNETGANFGKRALDGAEVSLNTFEGNDYDGLQGGPKDTDITQNRFVDNGRSGVALTSFGDADPNKGAQNCVITQNFFSGNVSEDLLFSSGQAPGTIATNSASGNSFGSAVAVTYGSGDGTGDTIDCSGNWWDSYTGPTVATHPGGTGSEIAGASGGLVDFTPWLDSGTDVGGDPSDGFQGDFSELWVDDDSPQSGTVGRAQEGIDLVTGSTVNIAPGTYLEPAQIVIDKDVTLIGAGKTATTLMPDFDTTGSAYGTTSSFILVEWTFDATIEALAIDGTGHIVQQGIQARGASLTVRDCDIRNIHATPASYDGRGITYLTGTGLVEDCTMSNIRRIGVHVRGAVEPVAPVVTVHGLTYVGKGEGDYLDYGVEAGGGGQATIEDCHITDCRGVASVDGSTSAGILATDFWGTGTWAHITGCTLTHNSTGIYAGYLPGDGTIVIANNNAIYANPLNTGIVAVTATPVDATNNWWGDPSGPYDEDNGGETNDVSITGCGGDPTLESNPGGTGDHVSDDASYAVDYCPWLTSYPRVTLEADAECYEASETVTVGIWMRDLVDEIRGGQFFLSYDNTVLDFVDAVVGDSPFTVEVINDVDEDAGTIDYAVGVTFGASGTSVDTKMAVLTFTALQQVCFEVDLITWRAHDPPSRLADDVGDPVYPLFVPLDVVDDTPPVLTGCPTDMTVNADAGSCTAVVTWTAPTAIDDCDPAPVVACSPPSGSTFPLGTTPVTCTATDSCGNVSTCDFDVTVLAYNEVVVTVELSPTLFDPNPGVADDTLTRCITFDLWECGGPSSVTVQEEITFTVDDGTPHVGSATLTNVPCGMYTCITARDELHTLRRTIDPLPVVSAQYVADFAAAGKDLIGGNLNDDYWIDILDFGVFSYKWAKKYLDGVEVSDPPFNGNTPCGTLAPHADIDGSGAVESADFTFISINFLQGHEPNCCGEPLRGDAEGGGGPITEISLAELKKRGLGHLEAGDLNHDGTLDEQDVAAFLMGERPKPPHPAQIRFDRGEEVETPELGIAEQPGTRKE